MKDFFLGFFNSDEERKMVFVLFIALVCFCFIAAQVIYFLFFRKNQDEQVFTVSREGLQEQSEKSKAIFSKMNMSEKEENVALLLLEEIVMRLHKHTDQVVTARVKNFYGKVSLHMFSYGEKYNPLDSLAEENDENEDSLRDLIFKANAMRLSYRRLGKRNIVVIKATKK